MPNPTQKNNPGSGGSSGTQSQNIRGGKEEHIPSGVRGGSQRPTPGSGGGSGGNTGSNHGGSSQSSTQGGPGGSNSGGSRRDPSQRVTSKPDTSLGNTSETSILRTCANTCYETFTYAIREGGSQFPPEQLLVLIDAAETCTYVANMAARGSEYVDAVKSCSADIVKAAEEMCEEFQDDDELFKACADVCRECYEHLASSE